MILVIRELYTLEQAPEDLVKRRIPMYDCDDNLRRARSGLVLDAYSRQFRKDFTQFLTVRGKELVPGGRMVISLFGRCSDNPASMATHAWEILASSLNDMVSRVSWFLHQYIRSLGSFVLVSCLKYVIPNNKLNI